MNEVQQAVLAERQRCEKILLGFLHRHKNHVLKATLLKSILKKMRKEKANEAVLDSLPR
jgi:hypothetical protein